MSTMVARAPHFVGGGGGYVYSNHERAYAYVEKGKGKMVMAWEYGYGEEKKGRRRGRSQQVSLAAIARRASEERRLQSRSEEGEGLDGVKAKKEKGEESRDYIVERRRGNFATGGTSTPKATICVNGNIRGQVAVPNVNHVLPDSLAPISQSPSSSHTTDNERESALDRLHLAYASDDMQLARRLVLELDGIVVESEDDPRIGMVKDEDFDRHFLPNGGLKLDVEDVHASPQPSSLSTRSLPGIGQQQQCHQSRGPNSVLGANFSDVFPDQSTAPVSVDAAADSQNSAASCGHTDKPQWLYSYMHMPVRTTTTARLPTSSCAPPPPSSHHPPRFSSISTQTMTTIVKSNCAVSLEEVRKSVNGRLFPDDASPFPTHKSSSPSPSMSMSSAHKKRKTKLSLLSTLLDEPSEGLHEVSQARIQRKSARHGSCDVCKSRKAYLTALSSASDAATLPSSPQSTAPTKQRSGLWLAFRSYAASATTLHLAPPRTDAESAPSIPAPSSTSSISSSSSSSSSSDSSASSEASLSSSPITSPSTSPCTSPPSMSPSNSPASLPSLDADDNKAYFNQSPLAKTKTSAFSWRSWLRPTSTNDAVNAPPLHANQVLDGVEGKAKLTARCSCPRHLEKFPVRLEDCPLSNAVYLSPSTSLDEDTMPTSLSSFSSMESSQSPSLVSPSPPSSTYYSLPSSLSLISITTQLSQIGKALQSFSQLNSAYVNAVVGMMDDGDDYYGGEEARKRRAMEERGIDDARGGERERGRERERRQGRSGVVYGVSGRRGAAVGLPSALGHPSSAAHIVSYSGGGMGVMSRMGMSGSGYTGYGFSGVQGSIQGRGMMNLGVREEHIYRRAPNHQYNPSSPHHPTNSQPRPAGKSGRVRVRKMRSGYRASREDVLRVFEPHTTRNHTVAILPTPPPSPSTSSPLSSSSPSLDPPSPRFMEDDGVVDIDAVDIPLATIPRGRKLFTSTRTDGVRTGGTSTGRGRAWQRRGYSGYSPYAHSAEYALSPVAPTVPATSTPSKKEGAVEADSTATTSALTSSTTPSPPAVQHAYIRPIANPVYLRLKAVRNTITKKGGVGASVTIVSAESKILDIPTNTEPVDTSSPSPSESSSSALPSSTSPTPSSASSPSLTEDPALSLSVGIVVRIRSGSMGSGKERVCGVGGGGRERSSLCFEGVVGGVDR